MKAEFEAAPHVEVKKTINVSRRDFQQFEHIECTQQDVFSFLFMINQLRFSDKVQIQPDLLAPTLFTSARFESLLCASRM